MFCEGMMEVGVFDGSTTGSSMRGSDERMDGSIVGASLGMLNTAFENSRKGSSSILNTSSSVMTEGEELGVGGIEDVVEEEPREMLLTSRPLEAMLLSINVGDRDMG